MRQMTLSSSGFDVHRKQTRRERFLAEMDAVVPWERLCALIEPHYPKGDRGRPPVGVERMLRIYFLQQWFNMSDPVPSRIVLEFDDVFRGSINLADQAARSRS